MDHERRTFTRKYLKLKRADAFCRGALQATGSESTNSQIKLE